MIKKIIIYYLEMLHPEAQVESAPINPMLEIRQAEIPCPELNRFFYTAIGSDYLWIDRIDWDYQTWLNYLNRPEVQTWISYISGTPFGYFELEKQPDSSVLLQYFGILPKFLGQGLGKYLLTETIKTAWKMQPTRVWVNTCTLDHPNALQNYQARGFKLYKTEEITKYFPDEKFDPRPGSNFRFREKIK